MKSICITLLLVLSLVPTFAQKKAKAKDHTPANVLLFPEFYHGPLHIGDTTFKYECYEKEQMIRTDSLHNTDAIDELWYVESFFDKRHPSGLGVSPPYLTRKLVIYAKVAPYTWAVTDRDTHSTTELKGDIHTITHADTTTIETATGKVTTINKYYKVTEVPVAERHENPHGH